MHVHHDDADPEHPIRQDNPQAFAPHACAAPVAGEPVFTKNTGTSFAAFEQLKRDEVREVCMIGMDGGQCINNNTRHAADLGFEVIVVADACASYAMEDYREGKEKRVITAEETHDVSMMMLSNGYAKVMGTDELLRKFESEK
jgi:nicotinamidase-related amidase